MSVIKAENVSKSYGLYRALENLNIDVDESKIFALLGPNGAGKTTFLRLMFNLIKADTGTILINGKSPQNCSSRLGVNYLPERFQFYPYYTASGVLEFYGKMHGVPEKDIRVQVSKALESVNILKIAGQRVNTLSKGQLQRVGIASLLIGESKLLVLDEPFTGIDPIAIKDIKEILLRLKKEEGKTIFINSHILSEMEQICDEIAILDKGVCLVQGNLNELIGEDTLENYFYKTVSH